MLSLAELVKLPETLASIKKIDLFLGSTAKGSIEYIKALAYKANVLHKIGKTNDALKLLYSYVPTFNQLDSESVIDICDEIINICMDVKRYDQVVKYMSVKKNYLSISNLHLFLKDQIRLYLDMNDYSKAKTVLEKYLDDDITKEEEIFALERLLEIYFRNQEYDKYLEKIGILENYYKDNLMLDNLSIIAYNKIYIDYYNKNYIKVIIDAKNYLNENNNPKYELMAANILIRCYLACSDYKKASIVEADYEELISKDYIEESIDFCYAALDLYTKMNSIISITEYHKKISELEEVKNPVKKKDKKKKEDNYSNIVIPTIEIPEDNINISDIAKGRILNPEEPVEINNQEIVLKEKSIKEIEISKEFKDLETVFEYINNSSLNMRLRDLFRAIGIEINNLFGNIEMYLLYNDGILKGLHYKMERAYDKKINIESIENTLNYGSYIYDSELFLDENDRKYNTNILTLEDYSDDIYGYAIPLNNHIGVIGSLAFISNEPFINVNYNYEALKLITKMFNTRLIFELQQQDVIFNNQKTFFIINNMNQGIKEESNGYIHLNNVAQEMLGALETLTFDDYINNMDKKYQSEYIRINNELNSSLSPNLSFEYKYKKNDNEYVYICEKFYPIMMDGNLFIFSLIEDITKYSDEKNKLIDLAYLNPISKCENELKMLIDLKKLDDIPYSLAIFDIVDFKIYTELYGLNFSNQLIYALGDSLSKAIISEFNISLYHLERDRYALLLKNINDKRVVESKLRFILNNVSKDLHNLNTRLNIIFNCGYYKVGKNEEINENDLISHVMDGLNDAYELNTNVNRICHYDSVLSKERFYENNLVTTISEAIDKNRLGLNYQQVVDLSNMSVHAFCVKLSLDNYEIEYDKVLKIAKRKNLLKQIDKYAINMVILELRTLYDKFKGFFNIILPINKSSIDDIFVKNVKTLLNHYKVNGAYITILVDNIVGIEDKLVKLRELEISIATKSLIDVFSGIPSILLYDYHNKMDESANDIKNICEKYNSLIIFDEINEKEDIMYAKDHNFKLIYGRYYKKLKRIKDIINDL